MYSYYSTLLDIWVDWCSDLLMGNFPDDAKTFNEAVGDSSSDCRSRAKEMFRLGLLSTELTQGAVALDQIRANRNVQSNLGYVSALIHLATIKYPSDILIKSEAALCAIFSVVQSVSWEGAEYSINAIALRLLEAFPCPDKFNKTTWLRYILSGFLCKVATATTEKDYELINRFFARESNSIELTIIDQKSGKITDVMRDSTDVEKAIVEKVSLTGIVQQKMALFILGRENDDIPKGFYSMASKYYFSFLKACYEAECSVSSSNPFLGLFDEDNPLSKKTVILSALKEITSSNEVLKNEYNTIMKDIIEGAKEALGLLQGTKKNTTSTTPSNYDKYLRALRTKPFMLLAGISGTGKSRIVRELAFKSCPEYLRDADGTTPGNYLMVEVKPNWHDSSELLGYYSHLANNGNGGYVFTPFTKFLVKAMMFPNVPFFVCLDEMNLAPVEQYFAEFLSVLETRKHDKDNYIQTGVLVKPEYFQGISDHVGDGYICTEFFPDGLPKIDYLVYTNTILTNKGLSLPDNVFVIGTVNMDDTTHQFSRKVIDRAMTIEMNGGKLTEMFGHSADLEYLPADQVWELEKFLPQYVNADEVVAAHPEYEWLIQTQLPAILEDINDVLRDTPFQVSYRVLNEMVIYFSVLVESGMPSEDAKNLAVDQMLLMKILPRIEGDRDLLMLDAQTCRLDKLEPFAISEDTKNKIAEMKNRLDKQEFTRFWP